MLALPSPITTLLLLTLTTTTTTATPIVPRAGGPVFTLIPATCKITHPLPNNSSGHMPSPSLTTSNQIHSVYFSTPQYTQTQQAQNCYEQCHGFPGCVAAFLAQQVPTPKGYYGTAGDDLTTACVFFNRTMGEGDFVTAPEGQYVEEMVANIECPK